MYFLVLGLLTALATDIFLWHYSFKEISSYLYRSHLRAVSPWDVVFPVIVKTVVVSSVILIAVAMLIIAILSRKISSGLHGFIKAIEGFGGGDLATPVQPGDIEGLNEKLEAARIAIRERLATLNDIQKNMKTVAASTGDPSYGEKPLRDLENLSMAFMKKLSEFRYN
ncbi:MAG: hypothetical protein HZC12_09665 [Nitrospirae bacterium]|nr:hypothetical protein [Nitrospirota bacterium]